MTDTPTTDTGTTGASSTDDTRSEASRATIETLLERVRALRDRRITPATEPGSPPVLLADGGQSDAKDITLRQGALSKPTAFGESVTPMAI